MNKNIAKSANGNKMYKRMRLPSVMFFVWLRGFIDSIFGKAGYVNDKLIAAYLTRMTNRYEAYAAGIVSQMNTAVIALTKRAELVLVRLSDLKQTEAKYSDDRDFMRDETLTLTERQRMYAQREAVKKQIEAEKEERSACVRELVVIRREIYDMEEKTTFWLLKTAESVNSVITSYANGVRTKTPVRRDMLPCVDINTLATALYDSYDPVTKHIIARMDEAISREST